MIVKYHKGGYMMEYTKDVVLHVNYGQGVENKKKVRKLFSKLSSVLAKHKMITTVISITTILMILDMMLVSSFIELLSIKF